MIQNYWLVEYTEAKPCLVYVKWNVYTCDPWEATRFRTKAAAEEYMVGRPGATPFLPPWQAVEHSFVSKHVIKRAS